jgi:hypothetical protein
MTAPTPEENTGAESGILGGSKGTGEGGDEESHPCGWVNGLKKIVEKAIRP